jgi:hypothetical protein
MLVRNTIGEGGEFGFIMRPTAISRLSAQAQASGSGAFDGCANGWFLDISSSHPFGLGARYRFQHGCTPSACQRPDL